MNNKGYSLLELIVVVAIFAIAAAIVGFTINTAFALEARGAAKKIMSELGREKVSAMSREGDAFMRVYKTSDGVFIDTWQNGSPTGESIKAGKGTVTVRYYSTNDAGTLDGDGIVIAFNRGDGSFKKIGDAWALYGTGSAPSDSDGYYTKIELLSGISGKTIELWPQTGKFDLA